MSDVTKQIAYLERQRKRHQDELPFAQGYAERDDTQFVIDAYSAAIEAISHAAGQDGEQCRSAPWDVLNRIADELELLVQSPFHPTRNQCREWVAEIRALSRGVPEGDSSDPERYRVLRDWFLRGGKLSEILPAGHVKRYSEAEFDVEIDRIRAIAAQRKEGSDA